MIKGLIMNLVLALVMNGNCNWRVKLQIPCKNLIRAEKTEKSLRFVTSVHCVRDHFRSVTPNEPQKAAPCHSSHVEEAGVKDAGAVREFIKDAHKETDQQKHRHLNTVSD